MSVDLSSLIFTYKIVGIGPAIGAASSFIFPLTYSIMDIIAEVYGFHTAKKIILYSLLCDFIFASLAFLVSFTPSLNQSDNYTYALVLRPLLRAVIAQAIGILSGAFINIYLISKWKIMTNGRHFWLRSIGSSTLGEAAMLVISAFIALTGVLSFNDILRLITYAYIYKILFAIAASPIISFVAAALKRNLDETEYETQFIHANIPNSHVFYSTAHEPLFARK